MTSPPIDGTGPFAPMHSISVPTGKSSLVFFGVAENTGGAEALNMGGAGGPMLEGEGTRCQAHNACGGGLFCARACFRGRGCQLGQVS